MKNKFTNLLKIGILLFGISLFLWNCENDYEITNTKVIENKKLDYTLEKISYSDLINDKEIKNSLPLITQRFSNSKNQNTQSRSPVKVADGFSIITDSINKIFTENVITWTFQVETPILEESGLENFLVKKYNDEFSYFLISYEKKNDNNDNSYKVAKLYPIPKENLDLSGVNLASKAGENLLTPHDDNEGGGTDNEPCEGEVIQICYPCFIPSYGVNGGNRCHDPARQNDDTLCTGTGGYLYTLFDFSGCEDGTYDPPSGPTNNTSDNDSNDNQNGGEPNGEGDSTMTYTVDLISENCPEIPILGDLNNDCILQEYESCFYNIGISNKMFNHLSSSDKNKVKAFITKNGCSSEGTKNFTKLAIEALDNDGIDDGEVDFDEQIINLLTTEKAKCIYDKLTESSADFKNMIQKFDGEFPVSHLKLEMRDLGNTRAVTDAPDGNTPNGNNSPDYVITIALNSNSNKHGVNYRPNLMNAKTIAHEIIHAEMYRKLLSVLDNGGNLQGVTRQQFLNVKNHFPGLFDYYTRYNFDTATPNNGQHQAMATHYRETLASILQVFDTGIPVPIDSNGKPIISQFYMDLSWEGLRYDGTTGNNAIYTWTSLPQPERERIDGVIKDYIEANKNENCN